VLARERERAVACGDERMHSFLLSTSSPSRQPFSHSLSLPSRPHAQQWDQYAKTGCLHGFTTNPSILLRDGCPGMTPKILAVLAGQAWNLGAQELHLQAHGGSAAALYSAGLDLAAIDPRIVVKVPATAAGVEAAALLKSAGAAVTLTGLFAAHQAMSAVAAGCDYAAPYLSRIAAAAPGRDGRLEVGAMQAVVENLDARTRILVASVKSVEDLVVLSTQGLNTFTLSPALFGELIGGEAATEAAAAEFEAAARQLGV